MADLPHMSKEEQQSIIESLERAAENMGSNLPPLPTPGEPVQEVEEKKEPERGAHSVNEFERLCRSGYLEKTVTVAGNDFTLKTLSQKEELKALNSSSRWSPNAQARAFSIYRLAQALIAINNQNWFNRMPLNTKDDTLEERFNYLVELNPYILNMVIDEYRKLETEISEKASYAKKD